MSIEGIIEGGIFNYRHESEELDPFSPAGRFKAMLERPDEALDLAEAALVIASLEYPGLSESYYLDRLDIMASDISLLLADATEPYTIINTLNNYLYGTLGFKGNETDYSDPANSFLNDVIERRTGIPITLSLVYLELGKRLGLPLEGVGLPGHFIVRYREQASQISGRLTLGRDWLEATEADNEPGQILLDPFNNGTILSEEDCLRLVRDIYGPGVPQVSNYLKPVTTRQFLARMLNNLKACYMAQEDFARALKIQEFILILNSQDWREIRDRGLLRYRSGQRWRAIYDLQTYLRKQPDAPDGEVILQQVRQIYKEIAERN